MFPFAPSCLEQTARKSVRDYGDDAQKSHDILTTPGSSYFSLFLLMTDLVLFFCLIACFRMFSESFPICLSGSFAVLNTVGCPRLF